MNRFFRYVAFALTLALLGANASEAIAQKAKKSSRRGPEGIKKGQVSTGNVDRQLLMDRQKAVASAKTSGGMNSGVRYSLPDNKYDTGVGRFSLGSYKNKTASKRATKVRKSKRLIDQDNPNGRIYQQSLNRRNRKFLVF
ncbi:hypothetical protein [Rufibacter tibetensis]|uniref:Uncharacterized protein n=1 Tax=Rufibacter tibetensis TaxID=512763 RepID=A0A0P0CU38_9BACT|nr:hypothetical protein [Rufibacter tibetensis]ALI98783.1 hypothetical protein DC20_07110 [Rufibacter tibetensis]